MLCLSDFEPYSRWVPLIAFPTFNDKVFITNLDVHFLVTRVRIVTFYIALSLRNSATNYYAKRVRKSQSVCLSQV